MNAAGVNDRELCFTEERLASGRTHMGDALPSSRQRKELCGRRDGSN